MHIPRDLDVNIARYISLEERKNYVPKKLVHSWESTHGHAKAITKICFSSSGHLLLSAAADVCCLPKIRVPFC